MAELDEDKIELLERQLAERVTNRVRPALFKLYATLGTTVIAVLGLVGWDVVSDLKSEIKDDVLAQISEDIGAKRREILERTTETQILARRANDVIQRVEDQLDEFEPKARDLNETMDKVKALNVTSQDFTAIYTREVQPLIANVEALSNQLSVLAEQVDELNHIVATASAMGIPVEEATAPAGVAPPPPPELEPLARVEEQAVQRSMAIQSVITEAKEAEQRLLEARKKSTVFFQFTGGSRDDAAAISAILKEQGYSVPGEDRERYAAGKHEVRFFHDDDRAAAKELAQITTGTLRKLGYSDQQVPDVTAESFVAYSGKKPRVGVLELWLEIP